MFVFSTRFNCRHIDLWRLSRQTDSVSASDIPVTQRINVKDSADLCVIPRTSAASQPRSFTILTESIADLDMSIDHEASVERKLFLFGCTCWCLQCIVWCAQFVTVVVDALYAIVDRTHSQLLLTDPNKQIGIFQQTLKRY
jgi:hypothetical protein